MRASRVIALAGATVALAAAGCGVPAEPKKQAEEVASVAAEGALLAHDAAEGKSTGPFTRTHARALRERLTPLRPKIVESRLARIAGRVDEALGELAKEPHDARVEARLEEAATAAEELAK